MARKAGILGKIGDQAKKFASGFNEDFGVGAEDARSQHYRQRELRNEQREAPKMEGMVGAFPLGYRVRELLGIADKEGLQAREEAGMALRKDKGKAHVAGQMAGTVAQDIVDDRTRGFYWLLNAMQASGAVINEQALALANKASKVAPNLYGKTTVTYTDKYGNQKPLRRSNVDEASEMKVGRNVGDKLELNRGYSFDKSDSKNPAIQKRNFDPGWVNALAVPSGIAINTGLGLMSPFGGAEGYKAANPSDEDPTKADNVLTEVALKYFMGRTGNLLPYSDFKQVRPDVSEDEYRRYQAFKYDQSGDFDLSDGDLTIPSGVVKYTNEGIHGPELQFLGRGLPVTTGVIPFLGAVAGGAAGVMRPRPIRGGFIGGMAGLAAGQVAGNLLEQERRRRNAAENGIELN